LGDKTLPENKRKHRIALCEWPLDSRKFHIDSRTLSPNAIFKWVKESGYDGLEITPH